MEPKEITTVLARSTKTQVYATTVQGTREITDG
jgi:hypothetical protein